MKTLTIALSGSGGAGAISTGEMLLNSAAKKGYHGLLKKTFSPQIRGGGAAASARGDLVLQPIERAVTSASRGIALGIMRVTRFEDPYRTSHR